MTSASREERFARFAERELDIGQRREPIWQQALNDCASDAKQALERYRQLRLEQMMQDEDAFEADKESLAALQRSIDRKNDDHPVMKSIWGVAMFFGVAVFVLVIGSLVLLLQGGHK